VNLKTLNILIAVTVIIFVFSCGKDDNPVTYKPLNIEIEMVYVQGGTFLMGDTLGDGSINEKPVHKVELSSFYIGKYEITQKEWKAIKGSNPSKNKDDDLPVEQVSWIDAVTFCNEISSNEGLALCYNITDTVVTCDFSANGYRLPTEAEWEFAAKGGIFSLGYKYSGSNTLDEVGWYSTNTDSTILVGQKTANELGLYDMSGNVWEWCNDYYGPFAADSLTNPIGPDTGSYRIRRGGGWGSTAWFCRSTNRFYYNPTKNYYALGFRVVRSAW